MLIGLDAGPGATTAAMADDSGAVLATVRTAGVSISARPEPEPLLVLRAALHGLYQKSGVPLPRVEHLVMAVHGVDLEAEFAGQHAAVCRDLGIAPARLTLTNPAIAALCGASPAARLTMIRHGETWASAFRGGHGGETLFDSLDAGGQTDLRWEAARLAARMIDGRAEPTPLLEAVLAHCGVAAEPYAAWAARDPGAVRRIQGLAPVVFEAWRAGDVAADDLVARAAEDYAATARAMGQRLAGAAPFQAAFGGALIAAGGEPFADFLRFHLAAKAPGARLVRVRLPAEAGALILAGQRIGLDPAAWFARLETAFAGRSAAA